MVYFLPSAGKVIAKIRVMQNGRLRYAKLEELAPRSSQRDFHLILDKDSICHLQFRLGPQDEEIERYCGQVSYATSILFRGQGLVNKCLEALKPVARSYGYNSLVKAKKSCLTFRPTLPKKKLPDFSTNPGPPPAGIFFSFFFSEPGRKNKF